MMESKFKPHGTPPLDVDLVNEKGEPTQHIFRVIDSLENSAFFKRWIL